MKKICLVLLAALLLAAAGCSPSQPQEESRLTVVATTYPVYLFASAVCEGVEGVTVERLNTGETSCLHDYTLTVDDMKLLEKADVIAMNGVGLEEFMDDALATSSAQVIDCSQGVELLENLTHDHEEGEGDDHDHGHYDPHIWMDPNRAVQMVENIQSGMSQADPEFSQTYVSNAAEAQMFLQNWDSLVWDILNGLTEEGVQVAGKEFSVPGLITFHDGFQYFAKAYDFPLLESIEEEAGSEASAKEITEITELVQEYRIPVIFTEVNGSDATAKAISRETGCQVAQLTMLMDGPDDQLENYYDGLLQNIKAIVNGFAGEVVIE